MFLVSWLYIPLYIHEYPIENWWFFIPFLWLSHMFAGQYHYKWSSILHLKSSIDSSLKRGCSFYYVLLFHHQTSFHFRLLLPQVLMILPYSPWIIIHFAVTNRSLSRLSFQLARIFLCSGRQWRQPRKWWAWIVVRGGGRFFGFVNFRGCQNDLTGCRIEVLMMGDVPVPILIYHLVI